MSIEIFPVVHHYDPDQTVEQSQAAVEAGADGVFLIDHTSHTPNSLMGAYNAVTQELEGEFVGLNFLQYGSGYDAYNFVLNQYQTGDLNRLPDAIWTDDYAPKKFELLQLREIYLQLNDVLYLGGVAFKGTEQYTDDPQKSASQAYLSKTYVDVVTTSGRGTGFPPPPDKIKVMKDAIGDRPLAVASGMSAENIDDYAGSFDMLLVSSSIETSKYSGIFDPSKLADMVAAAHET